MDNNKDIAVVDEAAREDSGIEPLISLANALFDTDRLRIAAALLNGPSSRMELAQVTGLSHRELLRQLNLLQYFGLVKAEEASPRHPDPYSRFLLNEEAFKAARQAMSRYRGRKPRPTDKRELTLDTFMPDGKLNAFPLKQEQIVVILDEVVKKFDTEKQYTEKQVNVILEDVNEDYCTLRRMLVDYRYLSRSK